MTDHKQIFLRLNKYEPPKKVRTTYEAIDYKHLYTEMESYETESAADTYGYLENKIKQCVAHNRVVRTKTLNPPKNDWINSVRITGITQRNYLWLQHKKHQDDQSLEQEYKQKRDTVAKLIQNTKNSYYYKLFTKYNNTIGSLLANNIPKKYHDSTLNPDFIQQKLNDHQLSAFTPCNAN